jgi:hypothetical protein
VQLEPSDATPPADLVVLLRPSRFHVGAKGGEARDIAIDASRRFAASGLPLAAYEARVHAADWEGQPMEVTLSGLVPHCDITLRAFRRADLLGYVRDVTRAPLEKTRVSIQGQSERGARVALETATAADGSFRFDKLEDGNYVAKVGFPNIPLRAPTQFEVRGGKAPTLLLECPRLCGIEARVVVRGVKVPVEGFFVTCLRTETKLGGEVESLLTDDDGRVTFRNLPPGKYALRGSREYFRRVNETIVLEEGKVEKVTLDAYPLLDDLLQSLNPNPKPDNR